MRYLLPLWMAAIVALSMIPLPLKYMLGTTGVLHSWGHFFVFVVTAILLCWNVANLRTRLSRCGVAVAFGIALEWMEHVVYRSQFEWHDVLVDSLGVAIGFALVTAIPLLRSSEPEG